MNKYFKIENYKKYTIAKLNEQIANCKLKGKRLETFTNKRLDSIKAIEEKRQELLTIVLPTEFTIDVEWVRNSTWGNNSAKSELYIYNGYIGETINRSASGCGYDKLSSAISYCFNESDLIKAILLQNIDVLNKNINDTYNLNDNFVFSYGCGISCFERIFNFLGYKWEHREGKTWDCFTITKKGVKNSVK